MKNTLCIVLGSFSLVTSLLAETVSPTADEPILPVAIQIEKRIPINLQSIQELRTYASDNNYYFTVKLRPGLRVLYSTSYGIGGEAGQAAGVVVEEGGKFWFKQKVNTTTQLLLPPGQTLNQSTKVDHSLWDLGAYLDLVNRVSYSARNDTYKTVHDIYGKPDAAVVDFKGGTAGKLVTYEDALEVTYNKKVTGRSKSDLRVYYAKGIGPVALEFREDNAPSGTFKFYMGE